MPHSRYARLASCELPVFGSVNIVFSFYFINICVVFQAASLEGKVWLCPLSSHALSALFDRGQRVVERTPPCTMKAVKNETEIQGELATCCTQGELTD